MKEKNASLNCKRFHKTVSETKNVKAERLTLLLLATGKLCLRLTLLLLGKVKLYL